MDIDKIVILMLAICSMISAILLVRMQVQITEFSKCLALLVKLYLDDRSKKGEDDEKN